MQTIEKFGKSCHTYELVNPYRDLDSIKDALIKRGAGFKKERKCNNAQRPKKRKR